MEIPAECKTWKEAMEKDGETQRVLANLRSDPLVIKDVADEFFGRVRKKLVGFSRALSPQDAWDVAKQIVRSDPVTLICRGPEVSDVMFELLLRFCSVHALRYAIPEDVLDAKGLTDHQFWDDIHEDDLAELTDDYKGAVRLGNLLQVVWATAFAAAEPYLGVPSEMVRRLAIDPSTYVLCVYNRSEIVGNLHVPTSLDAMDQPLFRVSTSASAPFGRTVPVSGPPEDGLPEAVHRRCQVVPAQWRLVNL
jgi:hypothetical protein